MSIKEKLHDLIENIENETELEKYYSILTILHPIRFGSNYEKLTPIQKENLEKSYLDSFDERNLIPHSEMKKTYSKWLTK